MAKKKARTYSDGGARGNPGPAGYGAVVQLFDEDMGVYSTVRELKKFLGTMTNNQAEYLGLIAGIESAVSLEVEEIECLLDSELLVRQLNGEYRVKDMKMKELYERVQGLLGSFQRISFKHIRREFNKEADRLVNEAIDAGIR
ncbi:MAG: ribonuclease HI family protein [bacterium]|nr:ribonuclease HI family protein [bacterium]